MILKSWLAHGRLKEHRTSPQEINDLLVLADRDLGDCRISGLSSDRRLNIAYNAALQASRAALAAAGFRTSGESHHYLVVQSLAHTINASPDILQLLDQFRKKRNMGEYDRVGVASDQEVEEMIALALKIRHEVEEWLRAAHPGLLKQ